MKNKKMYVFIGLVFLFVFGVFGNNVVKSEPISPGVPRSETGVYDLGIIKEIPNIITIDNNWSETVIMYDWCTGKGTESDPYIIQDVKIDTKDQRYAIKINKGTNFVIRNSIFTNTTNVGETTAAIYIVEAESGVIEHNNFTFSKTGIFSAKAKKMDISYNSFVGDFKATSGIGKAFWIYEGEELTITYNYILDYYDGISIWDAKENKIENNHIENYKFGYDVETGITFNNVNDSTIVNNDFYGVYATIQDSKGIETSGLKTSSTSYFNVIKLYDSYNIKISGNRFYDTNGSLIYTGESIDSILILYLISMLIIFITICLVYIIKIKAKKRLEDE